MKVLITGASGFLGGHLAELCLACGHRARGLVRRTSRTELLERLGVEVVRGDMKDEASLTRALEGIDVVIHAASTMAGVAQEYEEATVKGTARLLRLAEQAGVRRFLYVSSIAVHSMAGARRGEAITEETPYESDPRFLSNYVTSRIGAERAVLGSTRQGGVEVVVLRLAIMYGPRAKWQLTRIGYPFGDNCYVVVRSGRNPLPVCYVANCARAILAAAECSGVSGESFNIVDDETFGPLEYLRRLKAEVRPRLKIVRVPYPLARCIAGAGELLGRLLHLPWPFRTSHLITCRTRAHYANEKAKRVLGWQSPVGKEEALAATMRYYAERERLSRKADMAALRSARPDGPALRACVIGGGMIAREHLKILGRMSNASVAAVCDLSEDVARQTAEQFNVPGSYTDAEEMLRAERPDVVHVLTPPQSHAALVKAAVEHGANVLVEKPMAMDAGEARQMAAWAEGKGVRVCVGHNKLYDPVVVEARRLVESGAVGDVLWVESYCGFDLGSNPASRYMVPGGEGHWTFDIPGGLYQNLAPHPMCLALELLGPPTRVQAHARYGRVLPHAGTDELRVILETPRAGGVVTVSIAASPRLEYLRIYGTRMIVHVDLLNQWLIPQSVLRGLPKPISRAITNLRHGWRVTKGTLGGMVKVLTKRWTPYEGMGILIREYYAALRDGREPPVTTEEGIQVMEVMDEVWRQIGPEAVRPSPPGAG